MSWVNLISAIIDRTTPFVITGQYEWNRSLASGQQGILIPPSGGSFPVTPVAKEIFWRTDQLVLYRRNDANTAWEAVVATPASHGSTHLPSGSDPLTTATVVTIGTANAEGTANAFARSDHVHAHGNQLGGTLHALATTSIPGFLSDTDKTKLDGIEVGAEVDDKDVQVSANDTTPGFLDTKVVAGPNVTVTEQNDGSNESLQVASTDETVKVSANDTTQGYLLAKLAAGGGIELTEQNDGANESLQVASSFPVAHIESQTLTTTTLVAALDAFAGSSLSPPEDGDYIVTFEADCRVTAAAGIMGIAVSLNAVATIQTASIRQIEGDDRSSAVTRIRLNGLTTGDTIHGVFGKVSGPGTAQIRNRSMTIERIN